MTNPRHAALILCLLATPAGAQSFYIDLTDPVCHVGAMTVVCPQWPPPTASSNGVVSGSCLTEGEWQMHHCICVGNSAGLGVTMCERNPEIGR